MKLVNYISNNTLANNFVSGTVLVLILAMNTGCQYKSIDEAYPMGTCDTRDVSYKKDIQPLLQANCYSCHSTQAGNAGSGGGANNILDTYETVASHARSGYLQANVYAELSSISHMPPGIVLPLCEMNKISAWVNQGYKNN